MKNEKRNNNSDSNSESLCEDINVSSKHIFCVSYFKNHILSREKVTKNIFGALSGINFFLFRFATENNSSNYYFKQLLFNLLYFL